MLKKQLNEQKILEVLIKQQVSRNVTAIAKKAGLSRTTTYDVLIRLYNKGLAVQVNGIIGRRLYWRYRLGVKQALKRGF